MPSLQYYAFNWSRPCYGVSKYIDYYYFVEQTLCHYFYMLTVLIVKDILVFLT